MSKAERQAGALEGFADTLPAYGFNPKPLRDTAAHLRALDASHQRLVKALNDLYLACPTSLECKDFHHSKSERHSGDQPCKPAAAFLLSLSAARAALEQAKALS